MHSSGRWPTFALFALTLAAPTGLCAQDRGFDLGMIRTGAAYAAKVAASAVFVSGRTLDSVRAEELAPDSDLTRVLAPLLKFELDREAGTLTAMLPMAKVTAVYTRGLGCVLVMEDTDAAALQRRSPPEGPQRPDPTTTDWPLGERLPTPKDDAAADDGIDRPAIERALDVAFAEPADGPARRTRAVVIVHRGRLVAERYRDGYDAQTLLPGWSMTKTLVDALVGIRVRQGKLALDRALATSDWPADDPRRKLTIADLLGMHSGLAWNESYEDSKSDALRMLFHSPDHGAVQLGKELAHAPRARFQYSSGTTNLLCRELRATFASDAEYWAFPRDQLFAPLGMHRALIETDPSGTFVGSSYGFATARDWARVGMLYAQDGMFAGKRILPAGWVARATTPIPASQGIYGSQIWLNADPDGDGPRQRRWADLPANLFYLDGYEGQTVVGLPTEQLVIARLGCTKAGGMGIRRLLRDVLAAIDG
ncbi:MAG: beta-lactamase family protein [bacterium]|nr:beta-lactamase family protein [bacterium]